jgi:cation diffusion facilitator family transporter
MSEHLVGDSIGVRRKRFVALSSVAAAVLLTGTKLTIGVLTGSLGILSEAAHSALDFVAAVITYFAVRMSDRPADADHTYGHGKVEALSALIETLLLLITCAWIVREALTRLLINAVHVEVTPWAFGVVLMSIVVDVSRSRALLRVAKEFQSQALEADALHFSTDVWSSMVVLIGLALVKFGQMTGRTAGFERADAIAALGVAVIVIHVSVRLGRRTIDVLLDRAPLGLADVIQRSVREVDGVVGCERVRLRAVGSRTFVDLTVIVPRGTPLERSHAVAGAVEEHILSRIANADVVVHVEPEQREDEPTVERVRRVAASLGHTVHSIVLWDHEDRTNVELHVEVSEGLDLGSAHQMADALEAAILTQLPQIDSVTIHLEPQEIRHAAAVDVTGSSRRLVNQVSRFAASTPGILECHDMKVVRTPDGVGVTMHCVFDAALSVAEVHRISSKLEERILAACTNVIRVTTHAEPAERHEA